MKFTTNLGDLWRSVNTPIGEDKVRTERDSSLDIGDAASSTTSPVSSQKEHSLEETSPPPYQPILDTASSSLQNIKSEIDKLIGVFKKLLTIPKDSPQRVEALTAFAHLLRSESFALVKLMVLLQKQLAMSLPREAPRMIQFFLNAEQLSREGGKKVIGNALQQEEVRADEESLYLVVCALKETGSVEMIVDLLRKGEVDERTALVPALARAGEIDFIIQLLYSGSKAHALLAVKCFKYLPSDFDGSKFEKILIEWAKGDEKDRESRKALCDSLGCRGTVIAVRNADQLPLTQEEHLFIMERVCSRETAALSWLLNECRTAGIESCKLYACLVAHMNLQVPIVDSFLAADYSSDLKNEVMERIVALGISFDIDQFRELYLKYKEDAAARSLLNEIWNKSM